MDGLLRKGKASVLTREVGEKVLSRLNAEHPVIKHQGVRRVIRWLQDKWWPYREHSVLNILRSCNNCTISKKLTFKTTQKPFNWPSEKFELVSIDYYGAGARQLKKYKGYVAILSIVERLTGFGMFLPVNSRRAQEAI